ncbi:Transposase DDE domain protein [Clostridium formicaceticum]|uniref:Transposase DDE domain protein n=1 Tax=Clostridium formicaceticum TaxID=1497 RepID=A0AAC9WHH1_9CLOT|nr:transposase [Clostridium formicaceticum]ARE87675.1 Transposase DDE domain protein [Clostridium formicaceticum]
MNSLKLAVIELIWSKSKETNKPVYMIIDDTVSEKTKPSSKAKNIIEKCSFHNSHLKRKTVYGHQLVVALLSCDGLVLPYAIKIYDKEKMSKIDIAIDFISSLPKPINKGYVLCDSWYSCKAIFTASLKVGYSYIGALKTNRVIYPKGHERLGAKLHKFAAGLDKDSFDLVTVKGEKYYIYNYIYNYIGNLNDMKKVSITLSYPEKSLHKEGALKAFISLDISLKPLDILTQYTDRWVIEPFFRDCKNYLGLDSYQVRSQRSINRYLVVMLLAYTYCKLYSKEIFHFNTGLKLAQKDLKKSQVIWIYSAATQGKPIEKIFEELKIA